MKAGEITAVADTGEEASESHSELPSAQGFDEGGFNHGIGRNLRKKFYFAGDMAEHFPPLRMEEKSYVDTRIVEGLEKAYKGIFRSAELEVVHGDEYAFLFHFNYMGRVISDMKLREV